jgi:cytidine deaminase
MNEPNIDALVQAAVAARKNAYAPYSKFSVGAAVWACDESLFTGCNVENASYGLTICAERVAINNGVSQGRQSFEAIAVATSRAASPCGACLQVLAEFCEQLAIVICNADGQIVHTSTLSEMLPHRFAAG